MHMPDKSTGSSPSNDMDVRIDKIERRLRLLTVRVKRNERAFADVTVVFKEVILTMLKVSKALKPVAKMFGDKVRGIMPSVGEDK